MTIEPSGRQYFHGIDVVRFLCSLSVVLFHLGYSAFHPGSRGYPLTEGLPAVSYGSLFYWGAVGVPVFFVISGLVIANSASAGNALVFMRGRIERLYPAVWICATISFVIWLAYGVGSVSDLLQFYLRSMALLPFGREWIDAPYWTLGHEIVFYGLIWLVLVSGNTQKLPQVAAGIAGWSALCWMLQAIELASHQRIPGFHWFFNGIGIVLLTRYGCFFALGMCLWQTSAGRSSALVRATLAVSFGTCLATMIMMQKREAIDPLPIVIWVAAMIFIAFSARAATQTRLSPRLLGLARTLGLATYPLYLVHFALGLSLIRWLVQRGVPVDFALPPVVAMLIALSIVLSTWVEPAIRRQMRKAFNWGEAQVRRRGALAS